MSGYPQILGFCQLNYLVLYGISLVSTQVPYYNNKIYYNNNIFGTVLSLERERERERESASSRPPPTYPLYCCFFFHKKNNNTQQSTNDDDDLHRLRNTLLNAIVIKAQCRMLLLGIANTAIMNFLIDTFFFSYPMLFIVMQLGF